MADIQRPISTKDLKMTRLAQARGQYPPQFSVNYDSDFDVLMILIVLPGTEVVAHYIDDHIALLYDPKDLQVVGILVEDLECNFLPEHGPTQQE
jgi:hypothetical protein